MNLREMAVFVPLIAWAVWIGVYPKPYFDVLRQPVARDRGARAARIFQRRRRRSRSPAPARSTGWRCRREARR